MPPASIMLASTGVGEGHLMVLLDSETGGREAGIPPNMVQRWLGHAQLSTTAIYADAVAALAQAIAERMWE